MDIKHVNRIILSPGRLIAALLLFASALAHSSSTPEESCFESGVAPFSDIHLDLVKVEMSSTNALIGVFGLKNGSPRDIIYARGRSINNSFLVERPFSILEFRDLNGSWHPYIGMADEDVAARDKVEIKPSSAKQLRRSLFSKQAISEVISDFRLVLPVTIGEENLCLYSKPFRVKAGRILGVQLNRAIPAQPQH